MEYKTVCAGQQRGGLTAGAATTTGCSRLTKPQLKCIFKAHFHVDAGRHGQRAGPLK